MDLVPLAASAQIVVEPGHRRRGVGSRILDAVIEMACELGRRSLLAELATPHRVAQTTPGVAYLRWLQARHDASIVHTWNAEVNPPMLAVNQALGFRPVEYLGEWQREV
jgi:GNAT superfamily N-acetyltransferase